MKSVILASVLTLGSVGSFVVAGSQAAYAQELQQITGIQVNPEGEGIQIEVETSSGSAPRFLPPSPNYRNVLVIDLLDAQLAGGSFSQNDPAPGILSVSLDRRTDDSVRLTIIGSEQLPNVNVQAGDPGVVVSLGGSQVQDPVVMQPDPVPTPIASQPIADPTPRPQPEVPDLELEEITVTAERTDTYNPTRSTTATKTDTPIRDIPQSIQVVPQQVIQDQGGSRLEDVLRNLPGVTQTSSGRFNSTGFALRGFRINEFGDFGTILRDGLQDPLGTTVSSLSNVERVEVLRGPSSVLFGSGAPGGSINIITKKPLSEPYFEISTTLGSFDTYGGAIDWSGPLNEEGTLLYRLNASYRQDGSFIQFADNEVSLIAAVIDWVLSDRTKLSFSGEYRNLDSQLTAGQPAVGTTLPSPFGRVPRDLNISDSNSNVDVNGIYLRADLEHQFSQDWSIKSSFGYRTFREIRDGTSFPVRLLEDGRMLERQYQLSFFENDVYNFAADIIGNFQTGSVQHQLLFGVSYGQYDLLRSQGDGGLLADLDIFNPVYGQPPRTPLGDFFSFHTQSELDSFGLYIQDQITVSENVNLLLGGRFDAFDQIDKNKQTSTSIEQSGESFSPRVGIVYKPSEAVSLYASYSESFAPTFGRSFDSTPFEPGRGTQYEIGFKADLTDTLSTTFAIYDLIRTNVTTEDPVNPGFEVQTGEQRSQGMELTFSGEISPGFNIYTGYAYTDARITQDNSIPIGNQLNNIPEHSFNLWTTYEFQEGSLQGWRLGLGLFYVGEREGDLDNSFQLPSYLRTDEPNLEQMLLMRPELIISTSRLEAIHPSLLHMAPTVMLDVPRPPLTWEENLELVAQILNKEDLAEQILNRYETRIQQLQQALGESRLHTQVSVATVHAESYGTVAFGSQPTTGKILSDIGFQRPAFQQGDFFSKEHISEENLSDIDGDILFLSYEGEEGKRILDEIQQRPLWQTLNVVQNNRVYVVDNRAWYTFDVLGADAIIDDLFQYLVDAPDPGSEGIF